MLFSVLLLFLGACQKKPQSAAAPATPTPLVHFQRAELSFEAGNYAEAAQAYELYLQEDGTPANRDRVLFRLGLVHALPGSLVYDWAQAAKYLRELTDAFPQSLYAHEARLILELQEDVEHLQGEVERLQGDIAKRDAKIRQLSDEMERLKEIDLQRRPSRPPR
ncbi:MAG: tetratricopeptide repeat protein [Acidobacteria bacterium]|nr:tetratricopeptide repeat protein [Acidobacteriota bacterium]